MMDQAHAADGGPVTPKARHISGTSMITNPYRGDQARYPAAPYVTYAETGGRSQNPAVEEIDNSCVVYVNGLTNMTDDRILYDTFRQFGSIVSLVRRPVNYDVRPNSAMSQYAFIAFSNSQDAQDAIRKGEITLGDRKLTIKSRDKPGMSYHKHISHSYHNPQAYKVYKDKHGDDGREQILQLLNKNSRTGQQVKVAYEPQQQQQQEQKAQLHIPGQHVLTQAQTDSMSSDMYYGGSAGGPPGLKTNTNNSSSGQTPVLMSKALYVANLPIDMSPKELFTLFSGVGLAEGCYIFPYADAGNRRFGHIVMSSFYCAQKACEEFDGTTIRGCTLDVSYKTHPGPDGDPTNSSVVPFNPSYQPQIQQSYSQHFQPQFQQPINFAAPMYHPGFGQQAQQMTWLPQTYGSAAPGLVTPAGMIPFAHQFPQFPNIVPYAAYNTVNSMSPQGFEFQQVNNNSLPNTPPFQNFQDHITGWQGPTHTRPYPGGRSYANRRHNNGKSHRNFLNNKPSTNFTGRELINPTSDSSSTTLVSNGYEQARFDGPDTASSPAITSTPYSSPVIVNGSYPSSCETPSPNGFDEDTSGSDKNSTPSPVVIRSLPDPQLTPETPTRSSFRPTTFLSLSTSIIPETTEPADPANLFIKNLDDAVISDAEDLKLLFEPYGPVSSSFLATYPGSGISRGYGFVAFVKQEDANRAKAKLNGSIVGKKRVFVSYAERKEDRTQRLKGLFSGKGEAKKEKKKVVEGIGLAINHANKPAEGDEISKSVDHTKLPRSVPELSLEEPLINTEVPKTFEKHNGKIPSNDIPIVAEQEITVTTRWRGTQLTGIVEAIEEDDHPCIIVQKTSPARSTSTYIAPCIVQSPPGRVRGVENPLEIAQAVVSQQQMTTEAPKEQIPSPKEATTEVTVESNEQSSSHYQATQNDHERSGQGQYQNQGQNYGNGGGGGGPRQFYRSNNTGNTGEKSRLPVPRYLNGNFQVVQGFNAPTGPRMPYSGNGNTQRFYPTFPNNEPLGHGSGRKKNWKNSGNRRAGDNFAIQQPRGKDQQANNGIMSRAEVTASAY